MIINDIEARDENDPEYLNVYGDEVLTNREAAIRILGCQASTPALHCDTLQTADWLGIARTAPATTLAFQAWLEVFKAYGSPRDQLTTGDLDLAQILDGEAEALLRNGWVPALAPPGLPLEPAP